MQVLVYSEEGDSLKTVIDRVIGDADTTIIARPDGESVVVMTLDHYNSLTETIHLLKAPANALRLDQSIAQLRRSSHSMSDN